MDAPRSLMACFIRGYQHILSPDHGILKKIGITKGSTCGFYPTCSDYAIEAVQKHGIVRGGWLALKRIGRCHPWGDPKIDKVP